MQQETLTAPLPAKVQPKPNKPKTGDLPLYDVVVNIGGQILHTVAKEGVTAAEIALLRAKHGNDAILKVEDTNKIFKPAKKRRPADERPNAQTEAQRLKDIYGARAFAHCFGAGIGTGLPKTVEELPSEIMPFDPPKAEGVA